MSANWLKLNMHKTELLWTGTRHFLSLVGISFPSLQLAADTIHPSQHVRVLGVVISADLSLDKHVTNISVTCFSIFVVFDTSGVHSAKSLLQHWCMPL